MKRLLFFSLIIIASTLVLSGCTLPILGGRKKAALQVNSTPKATVFLNGQHVGQTPYIDENLKEGEFVVKLVPETAGATLGSWEGRVKLTSGILTVVSRNLAALDEDASGYVLSLEPEADSNKSSLTVVSTPDKAIITINGEPKGFAPLSLDGIAEGDHDIVVSLPGYIEQKIKAKMINGYKLVATVQLAKDKTTPEPEEKEATPAAEVDDEDTDEKVEEEEIKPTRAATSSAKLDRPYVTIKSPDIGWVRVRAEDSTTSEELAKVNDGESFKLLDTTPAGWYQIEYEEDKEGWISGKYAEKYE